MIYLQKAITLISKIYQNINFLFGYYDKMEKIYCQIVPTRTIKITPTFCQKLNTCTCVGRTNGSTP